MRPIYGRLLGLKTVSGFRALRFWDPRVPLKGSFKGSIRRSIRGRVLRSFEL